MKKAIALALTVIMMFALAACGSKVPDEKIKSVETKYTLAGELYAAAGAKLVALQNAGQEIDPSFLQSYSDYGATISDLGTQIAKDLAKLNEAQVDTLLSSLDAINANTKALSDSFDAIAVGGEGGGDSLAGTYWQATGALLADGTEVGQEIFESGVPSFEFAEGGIVIAYNDEQEAGQGQYTTDGQNITMTVNGEQQNMVFDGTNIIMAGDEMSIYFEQAN